MQENTPQAPTPPETQPVSQTPQPPPIVPQTPIEPTPPTKPKKWLIILISLLVLVGLSVGGFVVYKNVYDSKEEVIYKGIWDPLLVLEDENYLVSNSQKLKDLGINTIFIAAFPPFDKPDFEEIGERFSPELAKKIKSIILNEKELLIDTIQTAHKNGFMVALTVGDPPEKENVDLEALNLRIIEIAKLAEEQNVELFAPLNEPEMILKKNIGVWRQEILYKVKEVYHGDVTWNGAFPGFPDKESIAKTVEQPPGDYAGYDYIGFGTMLMSSQTLDEFAERVEGALDFSLAKAERDDCKGIIITEFGVLINGPWSEEEVARAYEIVLEKGKNRGVAGYFAFRFDFLEANLPGLVSKENLKTQEVIREWFTEILPEKQWVSY